MNLTNNNKVFLVITKIARNFSSFPFVRAIQKSMMSLMGVIMVGGIAAIILNMFPLIGWLDVTSSVYGLIRLVYNLTIGMLALYIVLFLSYNYAKSLNLDPLTSAVTNIISFLILVAPISKVLLANESSAWMINTGNLGATGLFVAYLVTFITVRIIWLYEKKIPKIPMPDAVPDVMVNGFQQIIPALFAIILWISLSYAITIGSSGAHDFTSLITAILSKPLGAVNSIPGMVMVILVQQILWCLGVHGGSVVQIVTMPLMMQDFTMNTDLIAGGGIPVWTPILFYSFAVATLGGTGNTLALIIGGLRSKSEKISAVSKASLIPGIFCINEPAVFGYPIAFNPTLWIPYIVSPLVCYLLIILASPILTAPSVLILSIMPVFVGTFLKTGSIINVLFDIVLLGISIVIYYPFIRLYEKQCIEEETLMKSADGLVENKP